LKANDRFVETYLPQECS